jgi:hypothetical protein
VCDESVIKVDNIQTAGLSAEVKAGNADKVVIICKSVFVIALFP